MLTTTTITLNKQCIDCKQLLPDEDFTKDAARFDGLRAECKNCRSLRRKGISVHRSPILQDPVSIPHFSIPLPSPFTMTPAESELPPVEKLPAAYLKRAHDYWEELVGGDTPTKRIA